LPDAPAPALRIGAPKAIAGRRYLSTWTVVRHAALAYSRPDRHSRAIARLAPRAPEGTPNLVAVVGRRSDGHARVWVHVRLPVLPNGTEGWIARTALAGYEQVRTHLVVDTKLLTATLTKNGRVVFRAPVGIGQTQWPTPRGEFTVRSKLTDYASAFYGPIAFGTTARSAVLTDWPAGGFVGIHGTNEPQLIPGRISHGCIRVRNDALLRLARLMPVGTPLTIR
jgi:lipoprotein-anchoring transpeptidase ErfK/SrfK